MEILFDYTFFDDDLQPEPDLRYKSGNESELQIIQDDDPQDHINTDSKTKADEGIENE